MRWLTPISTVSTASEDYFNIKKLQSFSEYEAGLDKYRLFKSKMFVLTGSKWAELSKSRQVCLGAQTSIDRLHWILQTVKNWSGPLSIALFVPDIEFQISKIYLSFIRRCFPGVKEQVTNKKRHLHFLVI